MEKAQSELPVDIKKGRLCLEGVLTRPKSGKGMVLFAHGSGSSRLSPRNRFVATALQKAGIGTLLFDLLTPEEENEDQWTGHLRFNIELLAERLFGATEWLLQDETMRDFRLGYFGASTGAAAALMAASALPNQISAIVSRGGRPDLAKDSLARVKAPTLLIVGANDTEVIRLNEKALKLIGAQEKKLEIVPGASHLFEERGTLEEAARLASEWFQKFLM